MQTSRTLTSLADQLERKAPCWVSLNFFAPTREAIESILPALRSLGYNVDPPKEEGLPTPGLSWEEISDKFRSAGLAVSSDSTIRILSNGPGWGVAAHTTSPVTRAQSSDWIGALGAALETHDVRLVGFGGRSAQKDLPPDSQQSDPSG